MVVMFKRTYSIHRVSWMKNQLAWRPLTEIIAREQTNLPATHGIPSPHLSRNCLRKPSSLPGTCNHCHLRAMSMLKKHVRADLKILVVASLPMHAHQAYAIGDHTWPLDKQKVKLAGPNMKGWAERSCEMKLIKQSHGMPVSAQSRNPNHINTRHRPQDVLFDTWPAARARRPDQSKGMAMRTFDCHTQHSPKSQTMWTLHTDPSITTFKEMPSAKRSNCVVKQHISLTITCPFQPTCLSRAMRMITNNVIVWNQTLNELVKAFMNSKPLASLPWLSLSLSLFSSFSNFTMISLIAGTKVHFSFIFHHLGRVAVKSCKICHVRQGASIAPGTVKPSKSITDATEV